MPVRLLPSAEYLRELFTYDPETGVVTWKSRPREQFQTYKGWAVWNANNAGNRAGNLKPNGYRRIRIDARSFQEHRVIWKMVTSTEPPETLDHKDGVPGNNRWANLRAASHREQLWNRRLGANNRSGYRGVSLQEGRYWIARINIDGNYRHLGCFNTKEEAAAAYEAVARKLHGKFYRER